MGHGLGGFVVNVAGFFACHFVICRVKLLNLETQGTQGYPLLRPGLLQRIVCRRDVDQRMYRRLRLIQHAQRFLVTIAGK